MGDPLVGGKLKRFELREVGEGVRASELSEVGDPEETETERALRGEVLIVMGSECFLWMGSVGMIRAEWMMQAEGRSFIMFQAHVVIANTPQVTSDHFYPRIHLAPS